MNEVTFMYHIAIVDNAKQRRVTVVSMEVLIKYCINSLLKLTDSFDRK